MVPVMYGESTVLIWRSIFLRSPRTKIADTRLFAERNRGQWASPDAEI
jgi:hypothetical protein